MRNYYADYSRYSFNPEDDWGDYDNGKYREPYFNKLGYSSHSYLCDDGKFHNMSEHTVKWEYFNGKIPEGYEIDHIIPVRNGGTNKLSNLRLVTHEENMNNEITTNENCAKGHWKVVYQYDLDNNLIKIWDSALDAAENGFYYQNIARCCRGERKTHKGYKWSYEPL